VAALAVKREQKVLEATANVAKKKKRTIKAQEASIKAAATATAAATAAAADATLKKAVADASSAAAAVASAYYKELLKASKKIADQATQIEETQEDELIDKLLNLSDDKIIEESLAI
jgi:hypothetical protein